MPEQIVDQNNNTLETMVMMGVRLDMKAMTPEQRGQVVHEISQNFIHEARVKDMAWIRLGMLWSFMVRNKLYRYMGDHIKNANMFLKEIDIGVKRRELETYAQMAGMFGRALRERNVEVPIRKLVMIAPLCTDQTLTDDWMEKAITLPTPALEDEVREAKGLTPRDVCAHPDATMEVWTRCGHCGRWLQKIRSVN